MGSSKGAGVGGMMTVVMGVLYDFAEKFNALRGKLERRVGYDEGL